jgi:hypothetical protein
MKSDFRRRVDQINAGKNAAVGDSVPSRQIGFPLAGRADEKVNTGGRGIQSLDDGRRIRSGKTNAEDAAGWSSDDHDFRRSEITDEPGPSYYVSRLSLELALVLNEIHRHMAIAGVDGLDQPSRQKTPDYGGPEAFGAELKYSSDQSALSRI